jgi:hypothetical protein
MVTYEVVEARSRLGKAACLALVPLCLSMFVGVAYADDIGVFDEKPLLHSLNSWKTSERSAAAAELAAHAQVIGDKYKSLGASEETAHGLVERVKALQGDPDSLPARLDLIGQYCAVSKELFVSFHEGSSFQAFDKALVVNPGISGNSAGFIAMVAVEVALVVGWFAGFWELFQQLLSHNPQARSGQPLSRGRLVRDIIPLRPVQKAGSKFFIAAFFIPVSVMTAVGLGFVFLGYNFLYVLCLEAACTIPIIISLAYLMVRQAVRFPGEYRLFQAFDSQDLDRVLKRHGILLCRISGGSR